GGGDLAGSALQVDEIALHMLVHRAERRGEHVIDRGLQLRDSPPPHGDRLDDWNTESTLERLWIELEAVTLGEVDHVERDDRRQAELDQLQCKTEMIVEVRRIEDDHQRVGRALSLLLPEQNVAGDGLIRARGFEAVCARQVDQLDRAAVGQRQPSRVSLNGDAGIIADLLPGARQRVEQRALAGIGAAGDGDEREGVHRIGWTRIAPACLRRIATVIRPTRIAIGSRPNGPRCSGSTATPSSKPKCLSRPASDSSSVAQSTEQTRAFVPTGSWSRLVTSS